MKYAELKNVVINASNRLKLIEKEVPGTFAALVFYSPAGICRVKSKMEDLALEIPDLFKPSAHFNALVANIIERMSLNETLDQLKLSKDPPKNKITEIQNALTRLLGEVEDILDKIEINEDLEIVIIFDQLDMEVVRKIKATSLIRKDLTMMRDASIKLVLGTIREFNYLNTSM